MTTYTTILTEDKKIQIGERVDRQAPTPRKASAMQALDEWWVNEDNHDLNLDEWIDAQAQLLQGDAYDPQTDWKAIALRLATDAASERLHVLAGDTTDREELIQWLIALAIDGPGLGRGDAR